jgi:ATP-dependent DNA ligase
MASYLYAPAPNGYRHATLVGQRFDHPDFLFELKHDGFRALAHIWDGKCELVSRKRNSYKTFKELRTNLARLKVKNAVIDGELVCLDLDGRSIFDELLHRKGSPVFYVFDLLDVNNRDLRQLPLVERKCKLRKSAPGSKSVVPSELLTCGSRAVPVVRGAALGHRVSPQQPAIGGCADRCSSDAGPLRSG